MRPYIAIYGGSSSLSIDYNALFPISSEMIISITTNGVDENCSIWLFPGDQIGTKTEVDLGPSTSEIIVTSIDPQEDDTYIYEVVVEY